MRRLLSFCLLICLLLTLFGCTSAPKEDSAVADTPIESAPQEPQPEDQPNDREEQPSNTPNPQPSTHTHSWEDATCTAPKTCSACGAKEGVALGHDYTVATCTAAARCTRCGKETEEKDAHSYNNQGVCTVCNALQPQQNQPITLQDAGIRAQVEEYLSLEHDLPYGGPYSAQDLSLVSAITINDSVESLEDLKYLTQLNTVTIRKSIGDMEILKSLPITRVTLYVYPFDISFMKDLRQVEHLSLVLVDAPTKGTIEDTLSSPKLKMLDLYCDNGQDLSFLKAVPELTYLNFGSVPAQIDLTPLKHLKKLETLFLQNTGWAMPKELDLSPLESLSALKTVYVPMDAQPETLAPAHNELLYRLHQKGVRIQRYGISKTLY